jgi:hypothetical protein
MKGDLNMGEEKKENDTRAMMQAYIELGKKLNTEKVMESYAYMHGQLETLRRYVMSHEYIDNKDIIAMMGWGEDGEH